MAAGGDAFNIAPTSVNAGNYLDIKTTGSNEAVIHNIYFGGKVEISSYDGTNECIWDQEDGQGAVINMSSHVTNLVYLRVKNVDSGAIFIAADGMYTK